MVSCSRDERAGSNKVNKNEERLKPPRPLSYGKGDKAAPKSLFRSNVYMCRVLARKSFASALLEPDLALFGPLLAPVILLVSCCNHLPTYTAIENQIPPK